MNGWRQLTKKNLLHHKKRTVMTILGLTLSCLLLFGMGIGASTIRDNMLRSTIYNEGDYHIAIKERSKSDLSKIGQDNDIKEIAIEIFLGEVSLKDYQIEADWNTLGVETSLVGGNSSYFKMLHLKTGRFPQNDQEIMLPDPLLKEDNLELSLGGKIKLNIAGKEKQYQIVGSYTGSLAGSSPLYTCFSSLEDGGGTLYLTYSKVSQVLDKAENLATTFQLKRSVVMGELVYQNMTLHTSLLGLYGITNQSGQMAMLLFCLLIILTVMAIVCVFVIYNSFAISVTERKKQLGILSSIGATPRQLLFSVFYEATILGAIAIPLGILLSFGFVQAILLVLNQVLIGIQTIPFHLSIYPPFFVVPFLFVLITIYLSAFFPAKRASEVTPMEAIRGTTDIRLTRRSIKTHSFIRKLFGVEGELALKNKKRNKKKYRVTILSLFISIILFNTFSTILNEMSKSIKSNIEPHTYDIQINAYDSDKSKIDKLHSDILMQPGITKSLSYQNDLFFIDLLDSHVYTEEVLKQMALEEAKRPTTVPSIYDGIRVVALDSAIYESLLKENNFNKDDLMLINQKTFYQFDPLTSVTLPLFKENVKMDLCQFDTKDYNHVVKLDCYDTWENFAYLKEVPEVLKGTFDLSSPVILVSKEQYQKIQAKGLSYRDGANLTLYFNTKKYDAFENYFNKVIEQNMVKQFQYQNPGHELDLLYRTMLSYRIVIYAVIGFIVFIGVTSVFNTIHTSILLRRKEFAMLRSVGLSPKGFRRMLRLETIFFGLTSLFYGMPVSLAIIALFYKIVHFGKVTTDPMADKVFHFSDIHFPIPYLIACIIGVFVIVFIAYQYATRKMKSENILEALKEDSF